MSQEYGPEQGPGRYVCRICGSDRLTLKGDGTWSAREQRMEFEEATEKPYCGRCEGETTWAEFVPLDARGEPSLCDDYEGIMYIVVDDEGEPVTQYTQSLRRLKAHRDEVMPTYRICKVGFNALIPDDGSSVEIVDDPKRAS